MSVGPNSTPTKILKLLKDEIASHLSDICNISFSMGIFPSVLKTAKIIPVHKKGSKLDCNNYRSISLSPNIEKVLVYNRITKFLNNNNLIYPLRFGFRYNYSTNHALISLTKDIGKNLEEGKVGCGIFVDLQIAFDTVDYNILLATLEHYGIHGVANDWFKVYLSDRSQFVSINGFNSDHAMLKHGVPQGSVLRSILFLIYINDLNHAMKYYKVHHVSDDTNLL